MNINDFKTTLPLEFQQHPSILMLLQYTHTCQIQIQEQQATIQRQQAQIQILLEKVDRLEKENKTLKDEINRLKRNPKRPKFTESTIEFSKKSPKLEKKNPDLTDSTSQNQKKICTEVIVPAKDVPEGSKLKSYKKFVVQEIELLAKEIVYKLEVWKAKNGALIRAELPPELNNKHYGPTLRALTTYLYDAGLTQPELHKFLTSIGCKISSAQVNNLLLSQAKTFENESLAILKTALENASYIRTDDTGEKHKHKNAYCTHIGGKHFAYYKTTFSKSRTNFISLLTQGKEQYEVNEEMIRHIFKYDQSENITKLISECFGKKYTSLESFRAALDGLGILQQDLRSKYEEAGAIGYLCHSVLKSGQILLSDRAGQFAILNHAACWVHMERPLRKINASCEKIGEEINNVRKAISNLYKQVKKASESQEGKEKAIEEYEALTEMKSASPTVNAVLANFKEYRDEMLKALDHPELPLHNNDSERDIRSFVKRRNLSGSTKSDEGRIFRDGLSSIRQTCFRLMINFWDYMNAHVRGNAPNLAKLVEKRYKDCAT